MSRRVIQVPSGPALQALRRALVLVLLTAFGPVPVAGLVLVAGPVPVARLPAGAEAAAEDVPPPAPETAGLVLSQVLGLRPSATAPAHRVDNLDRTTLWDWPLVGTPSVSRTFDPPAQRWLPGHRGIDLDGVAGEQVIAVDAGVVSFSGQIAGVGMVSVTHESGLRSTYQPVQDRAIRGDRVRRGQMIGVLDSTGGHCGVAGCLHLGAVRERDDYVDPLPLLLGVELTLLPVPP